MLSVRTSYYGRRMASVILVPGFWLDASSWDAVMPALREAGHDVRALTLPGTGSRDADRSSVGLRDHVAAVREAVDSAVGPVVLVGSSFAGALLQIVTDERPDLVELAVYVDALPKPLRAEAADEPAGDDHAFDWEEFTPDEQRDLTAEQRSSLEADAVPFPAKVIRDGWTLHDDRRYSVRSVIVASGFSRDVLDEWRRDYPDVADELDRYTDLTLVELPTSHWPHLTRPDAFARLLLDAIN